MGSKNYISFFSDIRPNNSICSIREITNWHSPEKSLSTHPRRSWSIPVKYTFLIYIVHIEYIIYIVHIILHMLYHVLDILYILYIIYIVYVVLCLNFDYWKDRRSVMNFPTVQRRRNLPVQLYITDTERQSKAEGRFFTHQRTRQVSLLVFGKRDIEQEWERKR